jgi:pheromone shutdown protein TraB
VDAAREISAEVVFGDRDVQITLRRCYASLGTLDRGKIIAALALLPFASAEVDEAEVERLKDRETITDAMSVFAEQMPALKTPLIDERDRYLASSMLGAKGSKVVAVVGAAHVAGIVRNLDREIDRDALVTLPQRARSPWAVVPLALLALVVALSVSRGLSPSAITELFERLAFPTSACSAAFVLAAGGGLSAALTAGALAPVSLFLPVFPLGRVASVVQGRARPPSEDDAGAVRLDMLSPSRFRKNSFLLVLLVFIASRFGRTTGAFFGFLWVAIRLLHMR